FCLFVLSTGGALANTPSLVVFTEVSPPYQYQAGDQVSGIATERVRNIISHAGLTAEFKIYPWARAMLNVERSSRALIYSIAKTPQREDRFHWIAPVARFDLSILSLAKRSDIQLDGQLSLNGLSAAAQRGDIAESWLVTKGLREGQDLLICADILCSWQQLKLGTVDIIIEDPKLIDATAELAGLQAADIKVVQSIPALSVVAYLAANGDMEPEIVKRLQLAARELGYR
ncbi:MAG: transporter substrate-binding domain-containing protein, partial [Pseudomonadota bacterium]|nr:transporter substrate-binding domain-containing protein [Pseudomonadota bacterium]